jgi:hypothetical protein
VNSDPVGVIEIQLADSLEFALKLGHRSDFILNQLCDIECDRNKKLFLNLDEYVLAGTALKIAVRRSNNVWVAAQVDLNCLVCWRSVSFSGDIFTIFKPLNER